jgi:MFS family permease
MSSNAAQVTKKSPQRHKTPAMSWVVWGIASLFFFYQFIVRVSPGTYVESIISDLSITACQAGSIISLYYIAYTVMQIPTGLILDNLGVRRSITIACATVAAGCYLFATYDSVVIMSIGRALMGIGSAFGFLGCVKIASSWFSSERLPLVIGLTVFVGPFGATFGGYPFSQFVGYVGGWRNSLWFLAVLGAFLTVILYMVIKEKKKEDTRKSLDNKTHFLEHLINIVKNPQTFIYGLYGFCMYIPLSAYTDLWGAPYLLKSYDLTKSEASGIISMVYMGVAVGGPLTAWLVQVSGSYRRVIIPTSIASACLFLIILYADVLSAQMLYALNFSLGILLSSQFLAFSCVCEINTRDVSATASSIHNMMCMISGIIFQPLVGLLLDYNASGAIAENGEVAYSLADYQYALVSIPVALGIAFVMSFLMKEAFPKNATI